MKNDRFGFTRRWLGRLSFSFFVIAFFLAWEGYKRYTDGAIDGRMVMCFIVSALSSVLGFVGVRERHGNYLA